MSKISDFLIMTVKSAADLITDEFEIKAKGNSSTGDLVTSFDYEVERFLIDRIEKEYPGYSIISEEFNTDKKLTDNCFTIDPIDGTVNFAHGNPLWGIQVCAVESGKPCASVIYLPRLNEFYHANEIGSFLNGNPIHVNDCTPEKGLYV